MLLVVGQILRPHGVRGEFLVRVTTDEPAIRYAGGAVLRTAPRAYPSRAPEPRLAAGAAPVVVPRPGVASSGAAAHGAAAPGVAAVGGAASHVAASDMAASDVAPSDMAASDVGLVGGRTHEVPATLQVQSARPHQERLIVAFEGVLDRDGAEALRGVQLCVDSAEVAPPTEPDEYHDFQLVGLAAVDSRRHRLGDVIRVEHGPGPDLLVVELTSGKQVLVPFVHAIVPEVDLAAGQVVLTPPEGLFDL